MILEVHVRAARLADAPGMHAIRLAVRENRLSDPARVSEASYARYMTGGGLAWVAEEADRMLGFAIVDLVAGSVWALFVDPAAQGQGIGRRLLDTLLVGSATCLNTLWLTTSAGTRAEHFYESAGWLRAGTLPNGEVRFERSI